MEIEQYRWRLSEQLWTYAHHTNVLKKAARVWGKAGTTAVYEDTQWLAKSLPFPGEAIPTATIQNALAECQSRGLRGVEPADIFNVMRTAAKLPGTVPYGDPEKIAAEREERMAIVRLRIASLDGIRNYMLSIWPSDVTDEEMAERIGYSIRFVKNNLEAREMKVADFLVLMRGLGRPPIDSLREMAEAIEKLYRR